MSLKILRTFWKLMCVQTQCSSEEAFRVFGRNLTILGRSLLIAEEASSLQWRSAANAFLHRKRISERHSESWHQF